MRNLWEIASDVSAIASVLDEGDTYRHSAEQLRRLANEVRDNARREEEEGRAEAEAMGYALGVLAADVGMSSDLARFVELVAARFSEEPPAGWMDRLLVKWNALRHRQSVPHVAACRSPEESSAACCNCCCAPAPDFGCGCACHGPGPVTG